jgi:beta-glucosidase
MYYNKKNTGRPTSNPVLYDDIPVGVAQFSIGADSYWLEYGDKPLYPFGYGLTYTTFEYGPVTLSDTILPFDSSPHHLVAACTITNTGNREAVAVPQLYIRDLVGSLTRPIRELKGFQRITIPAGEARTVRFELTADDLAYWHLAEGVTLGADGAYTCSAEPGEFHVWIAPNAAEGTPAKFILQD